MQHPEEPKDKQTELLERINSKMKENNGYLKGMNEKMIVTIVIVTICVAVNIFCWWQMGWLN